MQLFRSECMKSAWFFWGSVGLGLLGANMNSLLPVQAEPAPLFAPILPEVRQKLPQGLQMRLPATLPNRPEPLYPFVQSNQQGVMIYLAIDAKCKKVKCSVGGAGVFTDAGVAVWQPYLGGATPVPLPNGVQGYYVQLGKGQETGHYVIWKQEGSNYVVGTNSQSASKQELVQVASSMVSEPAIR
jgi:hypothetical protein